jgi:glucose/arabinose dehydrogenase
VNPRTGAFTTYATGFTNIMDLAFDRDGTLYVLEIDHDSLLGPGTDGAIFAVDRRGRRQIELPAGALPEPGGITVGKDGLYVTTNATSAGGGQVVRITSRR